MKPESCKNFHPLATLESLSIEVMNRISDSGQANIENQFSIIVCNRE